MIRAMLTGKGPSRMDPTDQTVLFRKAAVQRVFQALVGCTFERQFVFSVAEVARLTWAFSKVRPCRGEVG